MRCMAPAPVQPAETAPLPGLRERKKIQTRRAIREAAHRLFAERGYDVTSVDRIAEAADVSPSTVLRYFPAKEDLVLTGACEPAVLAALAARPAEEPPGTALRNAVLEVVRQAARDEPAEAHRRMRLVCAVPALRARMTDQVSAAGRCLAGVLSARAGQRGDELELRVWTGALLGAWTEALFCWGESGRPEDLLETVGRALTVLEDGLSCAATVPGCPGPPSARRR